MNSLDEILKPINEIIESYRNTPIGNAEHLNRQLKSLSAWLFNLETHRVEFHDSFECIVHKHVSNGMSVSKAVNIANVEVPELYLCRRILDSAYRVTDAMRSNISYIKSEKSISNTQT